MHDPHSPSDLSDHGAIHGHGPADAHEDHAGHGIAKYLYVFGALTLLTTASFMTYTDLWRSHVRSEAAGWAFMMAVSCTKALLVMLFFMHLRGGPALPRLVFASGFLWLAILIGISLSDYFSRGWLAGEPADTAAAAQGGFP